MTRTELIQEVARAINEHMEITYRDAEEIVNEIINSMINALKAGDEVEIRGFGSFRIRTRNARNGRNPKNGALVEVPSKSVVYFKQGKDLKQSLLKSN
ncbi:MAG: integration host factor subunit beta [Blastocatellia bacterium]|nr:integration host factor subunit beta [Blastocatellia bacterium]